MADYYGTGYGCIGTSRRRLADHFASIAPDMANALN